MMNNYSLVDINPDEGFQLLDNIQMLEDLLTCKYDNENEANKICQTRRPRKRSKIDPNPSKMTITENIWLNKENVCSPDNMLMKLTRHFHEYLKSNENQEINLSEACEKLGINKRRIYDVVNVMESVNLLKRTKKNHFKYIRPIQQSSQKIDCLRKEIRKLEKEENKLDNLIESLQVRHQKLLKTKNNDLKLDFNKDFDEYLMKKNFILVYEIPEKSELKLNVPVNKVYYEQLNKQLKTVEGSLSFQSIKFKLEQIPNLSKSSISVKNDSAMQECNFVTSHSIHTCHFKSQLD